MNAEQLEISAVIEQTGRERRFGLRNETGEFHLLARPEMLRRIASADDGERPDGATPRVALSKANVRHFNLRQRPCAIIIRALVRRFDDAPAHCQNAWLGA